MENNPKQIHNMKNISHMKKNRTYGGDAYLRVLALLILTCIAGVSMADTYHLFFKYNNSNPSAFEDIGGSTGTTVFSWTVTMPKEQYANYYFFVSTSDSYTDNIDLTTSDLIDNASEEFSKIDNQSYNIGDKTYEFVFVCRRSATADYTMKITYNKTSGKYTLEDASACSMQIKHAWNGGSQTWQSMSSAGSNVFTYVGQYGGTDVCQISNDGGTSNTHYNATVTGSPSLGDDCTFSFTSTGSCATSGGTMTISKNTDASFYVAGNGTDGGIYNWCDSENWKANGSPMYGTPASVTFSEVYYTSSNKPKFKITNGKWHEETGGADYDYTYWDEDTSDLNGITVQSDGDEHKNIQINLSSGESNKQNITITFNSSTNKIHIKCTDVATLPEIYIGEQPQKEGNTLAGSVYLAQTGGATITDIRVYYQKDAEPNVSTSPYVTLAGPFACGNLYPFTIDEICTIGSGDYQIKAQATNSAGSQASDVVAFNNFVCCPGSIETLAVKPEAESVIAGESYGFFATIEGGGANPTYLWEVKIGDGEWEAQSSRAKDMYYPVPENVSGGTNIYVRVTATGSNCEDTRTANTMVTACYTPAILSLDGPEDDPYAWDNVNVTAEITNSSYYEWSVNPTATLINPSATGVTFKGGTVNKSETDYTVTLTIGENQCGNKVSKDVEIRVKPDKDNCTPAP